MSRRALPDPGRTRVMGILNLTPDSFSDGGRHARPEDAVGEGLRQVEDGADVLDLGAVSTRPGAEPVAPEEEWRRLEPVLGPLRARTHVPLSLDTTSAVVLERALEIGVDLVNDTSALADDPDLASLVAQTGLPIVLVHRRGTPRTMQRAPHYEDPLEEVTSELLAGVERACAAGIARDRILLDPGIGFGKRHDDNLDLLAGLPRLAGSGFRTVLGCSRKAFLGTLTGRDVEAREHATTATTVLAALAGVDFVRVHAVRAATDALAVVHAVASRGCPG